MKIFEEIVFNFRAYGLSVRDRDGVFEFSNGALLAVDYEHSEAYDGITTVIVN